MLRLAPDWPDRTSGFLLRINGRSADATPSKALPSPCPRNRHRSV